MDLTFFAIPNKPIQGKNVAVEHESRLVNEKGHILRSVSDTVLNNLWQTL